MAKSLRLRRTHNAPVHPSINPQAHRGNGTARGFLPGLGLEVNPQNVIATRSGTDANLTASVPTR